MLKVNKRWSLVRIDDICFLERDDESLKIPKETWSILNPFSFSQSNPFALESKTTVTKQPSSSSFAVDLFWLISRSDQSMQRLLQSIHVKHLCFQLNSNVNTSKLGWNTAKMGWILQSWGEYYKVGVNTTKMGWVLRNWGEYCEVGVEYYKVGVNTTKLGWNTTKLGWILRSWG